MLSCLCGASDGSRLLDAARSGDVQVAIDLIKKKPKLVRAQQWGGQTAWHMAAKAGHADVLQAMADTIRGLSAAELDPLLSLGRRADKIVTHLAQEGDTKCLTPLHLACIKGHAEAAGLLMKLGVNPFLMDSVGRTALHYAASWGHADCINAVLSAHSGTPKPGWRIGWPNTEDTKLVDVQNMSGFTPLHYAVWVGRKEAIQALASYDASLEVVNNCNDYDWIKVGAGNTPLHLAAFGGDFDVVKLLLAAHVQTLAAGTEVMSAAQGQWGQRYANDVRHMRNRRGLMPYHIAVHKHFQNLTELLHPDIPYTFIFSNDDMDVGSVRMYGPARLMVIAAKALQQKLISELEAVETAATAASPGAAAAAVGGAGAAAAAADKADAAGHAGAPPVLVVSAGPSTGSAQGSGLRENGPLQLKDQQLLPEVADAAAGAAAAAMGTSEAAAEVGSSTEVPLLLSPFAAKSHKHWASTSTGVENSSISSATPASSIGAGGPAVAAGQATRLMSDSDKSLAAAAAAGNASMVGGDCTVESAAPGPAAAAQIGALVAVEAQEPASAFAIQAANAGGIKGDAAAFQIVAGEHSFTAGVDGRLNSSATAPASLLLVVNSGKGSDARQTESSFAGFRDTPGSAAQQQQQQQQQQHLYSGAASDAGASAVSNGTIPGSTSAVAGTPADSIISPSDYASVVSFSQSRGGFASNNRSTGPGAAVDNVSDHSHGKRAMAGNIEHMPSYGSSLPDGFAAADDDDRSSAVHSSIRENANSQPVAATAASAAATSADDSAVRSIGPPPNGPVISNTSAPIQMRHRRVQSTVEQQMHGRVGPPGHARRATAEGLEHRRSGWLQSMGSFGRMQRRDLDAILPPSAIITTAFDDDSKSLTKQQQQQQQALQQRRSSIGQTSRFSVSGPAARNSSMRVSQEKVNTRPPSITEQRGMLMNESGETTVQQYRGAAGCLQERGSTDQPPSPGANVQENPLDVMLANRASKIGENPEAMRQQLVLMKLASGMLNFQTAVSAFNAAQTEALDVLQANSITGGTLRQRHAAGMSLAGVLSAPTEAGLSAAVPAGASDTVTAAAAAADPSAAWQGPAGVTAPPDDAATAGTVAGAAQLTKSNSLAAIRNNSCRNLIAQQPSLQRLMSGKISRTYDLASTRVSADNSGAAEAAIAAAAEIVATAGSVDAGSAHSTQAMPAACELPIIQQRTPATSGMIVEEDTCDLDECEICFDAHAVVRLQECGHVLCVGCCKEMCKLHHFKPALCPYCRQIICGFALHS